MKKKWWKNIETSSKSVFMTVGLTTATLVSLILFSVSTQAVPEVGGNIVGDCPDGQYLKNGWQCVDIPDCEEGEVFETSSGQCVKTNTSPGGGTSSGNPGGPHLTDCPDGQYENSNGFCEDIPDCAEGEYFSTSEGRCIDPDNTTPGTEGGTTPNVGEDKATRRQKCLDYGYEWDDSGDGSCDTPDTAKSEEACREWANKYGKEFDSETGVQWVEQNGVTTCWDNSRKITDVENAKDETECTASGGEWINGDCFYTKTEAGCTESGGVWDENDEDGDGQKCSRPASDDSEDTCEAGFFGFGWIFCPGQNLITNLLDGMMGWIEGSMKWTLLADQAESADGTSVRDVWQKFLNIANIIFVVGFLIMIYSMATSTGLSNYEIKRMLPRLVVVAIAVNLSFYICAALVDISNIVGASMYDLIYSNATSGDAWNILGNIANIASNIVLLVLALFLFGGSVIIAFAVIIACLAFRQVALVVLIIASPIAIAMYMLPNTEKWARKWFSMFARLLIIYPAFTAVWGAARLISNTFATNTGASTIPGFVMDFVCAIAPAVAIIPLFKMSGGLMAMAAGAVSGAAARTGIANKVNRAGRHAVVNNPATRGITRGISNATGRFGANNIQSTKGNRITRSARNWAGRKALGIANATNKHADAINSEIRALDSTAMEAAKNDVARYDSSQLLAIAKGGVMPDGSAANQYVQRAAMESAAKSMSANDVRDMMVNSAEQAAKLKQEGRDREAQALLNAATSAASESGNWLGGQGALNSFKDGKWGNNAAQAYTNAVASQAGNISKDALSKTSANNQIHMQQQLAAAQQAGNASADNQISHFREASAQVQADPKAMGNMKLDAQQQLTVNQTMRTTNEQRAANGIGLDAIRSNINQAQKAYDSAVQAGSQAAIAQAKTVLDGAHKQMAELGDKILTDNTAMQYFNNLSPADKSYVNSETLRWQGTTTSSPTSPTKGTTTSSPTSPVKGTPPTHP